ncbi:MAG: hypothetical protein COU31_04140 [Candidatus Magasanikbacteria bacterium CG10_big_fil_rev_8_21_14_0_10_40_10]|uniref:DUF5050 domain-containing protein n=1 Tax=Candidatus Magasanikbacteria bacterium CG10_big_fil_rev_8_21_14_0_10_40_10 TaxID=1974648 RepID=A0A2M6W337_9BACT|nr:MAG: hypothetical protein COU31_04140 [Candidatus Magasanikbacteria bacterium CG10_big_fil_rev_8_21_14_0_10_40_10]
MTSTNQGKNILLLALTLIILTAGVAIYLYINNNQSLTALSPTAVPTSTNSQPTTTAAATVSLPTKYLVTEDAIVEQGVRKQTGFSIYKTDGALVKKNNLPADAVRSAAGSNGIYGKKIYYLSGTETTTSLAELDPLTGASNIFSFTKTVSTNQGNVLFAIIAWAVSNDNKMLAWIDTQGTLHVADRDNTVSKTYPLKNGVYVGRAWVNFSQDNSSLYVWRQGEAILDKLDLTTGLFSNIITSENAKFLISPSGRYIVYANSKTPLAIRDLTTGQDSAIALTKSYDGWYLSAFSLDETSLYFGGFMMSVGTDYYMVKTDGSSLTAIQDTRLQNDLSFLSKDLVVTRCQQKTCLVNLADNKQPTVISDQWFLGSLDI